MVQEGSHFGMFFDDLGVPWGSALGTLGELSFDQCWSPFWRGFRNTVFRCVGTPKGFIFEAVFGTPSGAHFLTMPRVRAHFPGVHSGPLWSCILVILRVQPGTSISDHFGLHFGAPFPGPFGGPFGDRFLDLPVVLGTPFGVDFRPPFGIQLEPKMDAIWVCYVRPFGLILRIHFGVDLGPRWRLLRLWHRH